MKVRWCHMAEVSDRAKGRVEESLEALGDEMQEVSDVRIVGSHNASRGAPENEVRVTGRVNHAHVSVAHRDRDMIQALNRAEERFERAVRRRRARRRTARRARAAEHGGA